MKYYEDEYVTIYHGKNPITIPDEADFVFFDPPYNLGKDYGPEFKDDMKEELYIKWMMDVFSEAKTKPLAIYTPEKLLALALIALEDAKQIILRWTPHGPVRRGYRNQFASIVTNVFPKGNTGKIPDVWENLPSPRMGYAFHEPTFGHPGETSEGITGRVIGLLAPKAKTIYDPFAGTGTTGAVAKARGQKAILFEICECWCEIAAKRIAGTSPGLPLEIEPNEEIEPSLL